MRIRRAAVHGERGQTSAEYVGMLFVLVAVIAALLVAAPGIGDTVAGGIRTAICRITGGDCALDDIDRVRLACVTSAENRDNSLGINLRVVQLANDANSGIQAINVPDPSNPEGFRTIYRVTTESDTRAGVGTLLDNGRFNFEAAATGGLGGRAQYDFDNLDDAESFLSDRRGTVRQALALVGGTPFGGIEQLADGANRGARGAVDGFTNFVTFGNGTNLSEGGPPTPDRVSVTLDLEADAAGGVDLGQRGSDQDGSIAASGGLEGEANIGGILTWDLENGGYIHEGYASAGGGLSGELTAQPPGTGDALDARLGGTIGENRGFRYRVRFDEHGEPAQFTWVTESGSTREGEATLSAGGTSDGLRDGGDLGTSASDGELEVTERHIDLRDPENRAAFDEVFNTSTGLALPDPTGLGQIGDLNDRLDADGVEVVLDYDTAGEGSAAGAARQSQSGSGGNLRRLGVQYEDEDSARILTDAQVRDNATGGAFQDFALCGL